MTSISSPQTTGVIFKIERDTFRILDQTGTVRSLKPSQISGKVNSRGSVATDHNGLNISNDDEMVEIEKTAVSSPSLLKSKVKC